MRRITAFFAALTLAGAVLGARASNGRPPADDGVLAGRVVVLDPLTASRPAARGGEVPPPEVRREAVVFFEDVPKGEAPPPAVRVRLRQVNETFVPHLLAITAGSTVDFPNDDTTYHNVFSLSRTKRFDLGRYAAGKSKAVVFAKPGIVRVFCDIHSHMNAFILVFAHRFFAVTEPDGKYRIERVPPGTYRVTAWYEGIAQQTGRVTITGGATAELDFRLR